MTTIPVTENFEPDPVLEVIEDLPLFTVRRENEAYVVEGTWIENLVLSTNMSDDESFNYFQRTLRNKGVIEALEHAGIKEGDTVRMYDFEFDFVF